MLRDRDRVVRVGVWVVIAAAVAGLLALVLSATARADQPGGTEQVGSLLLDRTPISPFERFEAARELLRAEEEQRRWRLYGATLRAGWQVWIQGSPSRLLRSARDVAGELLSWRDRRASEDAALDLLETAVEAGAVGSPFVELYTRLRNREIEEHAAEALDAARTALDAGHLSLARIRLERSMTLAPESAGAGELLSRLIREERAAAIPEAEADIQAYEIRGWEAPLAASLLTGDYRRAVTLGASQPDAVLAHSVAYYLSGERGRAHRALSSLVDREDFMGQAARAWIQRPVFTARQRFAAERRRYRLRTTLGWLGGAQLARDGLEPSGRGYRAWRQSITPLNLALSLPARIFRGWRPQGKALWEAASTYLAVEPHGEDAASARTWLAKLGATKRQRIQQALESGRLELPQPLTHYPRLAPGPLILTRDVIESGYLAGIPILRDVLGDGEAIILRPIQDAVDLPMLPVAAAQELFSALAGALEDGYLESVGPAGEASLKGLSRLDRASQSGHSIVASAWHLGQGSEAHTVRAAAFTVTDTLFGDGSSSFNTVSISRGGDDLRVDRSFGGPGFVCPEGAVCLQRAPRVRGNVYGFAEVDGDLHLGARAEFQRASLAVDLSGSGPQASVHLPLAHWVGLERWIPIAVRLELGMDSVYVGPVLVVPDLETRADSSSPGLGRLKNLAKRFQ